MDDEDSLDSYFESDTGTSAYNSDAPLASDTGGAFNAASNPLNAAPDAGGGNGSYPSILQNTLTQGLSDAVVSATEFGLGSLVDRLTVNTNAQTTAAAAPAVKPGITVFGNISPGYLILGALGIFVVITMFRKG